MAELKPCPFCGGKGKVSFKDHLFAGYNGFGHRKVHYRVQIICNRCRSRGKPVVTDGLVNPWPYSTEWGKQYSPESESCKKQTEVFRPYVEKAMEAWNRRVGEGEKE